jgi:hypothetical protein
LPAGVRWSASQRMASTTLGRSVTSAEEVPPRAFGETRTTTTSSGPTFWCPSGLVVQCYRAAIRDVGSDEQLELPWREAPEGAVVIVDGLFLHRDELAGAWELSVFLQGSFEATVHRKASRDGSPADSSDPRMARYVGGQRLYFQACSPWEIASVVIDSNVVEAPVLLAMR